MANINHNMVNFKIFPFPARLSLNGVAANWAELSIMHLIPCKSFFNSKKIDPQEAVIAIIS